MTVSIIIPTYNCAHYLEEAIRSVMEQTYPDLEIIVVDDGSTDCTGKILDRLQKEDQRIIVVKQPRSGRAATARNSGLRAAEGQFVAFLDCDDVYHKTKIEHQIEVFRNNPDVDIVFGEVARFKTDVNDVTGHHYLGQQFLEVASPYLVHATGSLYLCREDFYKFMSIVETSINTQSVMFRRDILRMAGGQFPEDLIIGEDIDLWFRLVRIGKVAYLSETLAYYRSRPGSLTHNRVAALKGFVEVHSRNLQRGKDVFTEEEVKLYKERIAKNWSDLGYHYFCEFDTRKARVAYLSALKLDFHRHNLIGYLKACLPRQIIKALLPIWRKARYGGY